MEEIRTTKIFVMMRDKYLKAFVFVLLIWFSRTLSCGHGEREKMKFSAELHLSVFYITLEEHILRNIEWILNPIIQ